MSLERHRPIGPEDSIAYRGEEPQVDPSLPPVVQLPHQEPKIDPPLISDKWKEFGAHEEEWRDPFK